jgi:predicted enzyme related to lactoylglutathione lyase
MMNNRSVPTNTLIAHVYYRDVEEASAWLTKTFGFSEHFRYGDPSEVSGAQVHLGNAWIMLKRVRASNETPANAKIATQSLTIFVEDVDAHYQRTKQAEAKIVEDLNETIYGEKQYGVLDLDGHHWLFSQHVKDLNPADWGATVLKPAHRLALLPRPRVCYLEIPAVNLQVSIAFYEKVFGWNIRGRDSSHPSFDDATGDVSGAWTLNRKSAQVPGLLPYIWVDNIDAMLDRITAHGGVIIESAALDSPGGEWIATFRDPAGNVIGLYQEGKR